MAWLESHQSLASHRKLLHLADRTGVSEITLIGHLHLLWWWALDNVGPDGSLAGIPDRALAVAAHWPGDPQIWADALVTAGFVDVDEHGQRWLHDWYDYAGKLLERRAEDRERKRAQYRRRVSSREASRGPTDSPSETPTEIPTTLRETSAGVSQDPRTSLVRTQPNSTVPNPTEPRDPPPPFADANGSPPADAGGAPADDTAGAGLAFEPDGAASTPPRRAPRRFDPVVRDLVRQWRDELVARGVPLAHDWHLIAGGVVQAWVNAGKTLDEIQDWWAWARDHPWWATQRHVPKRWSESFGQWRLSQGAPLPRDRPNGGPRRDWLAGDAAVDALLGTAPRSPPTANAGPPHEEGDPHDAP